MNCFCFDFAGGKVFRNKKKYIYIFIKRKLYYKALTGVTHMTLQAKIQANLVAKEKKKKNSVSNVPFSPKKI